MKLANSPSHGCKRTSPKFELGRLLATPGALHAVSKDEVTEAIARHLSGDWGDLCPQDTADNEFGLTHSGRLCSRYYTEDGTLFYVITEWDRSVTTVLLPEEN